ncbi:MAG: acetate--CoA ligase [bacterium]|nr:acetate--CoA ligase [bacterium]
MEKELESLLKEDRVFSPSAEFKKQAAVKSREEYEALYKESINNPEGFWGKVAKELHWFKEWKNVLNEDEPPAYKWFEEGKTNIAYNCVDRYIDTPKRNKAAIIWEGEPGDSRVLTYWDLYREINKCANVLRNMGVKKGDRVIIYLPMIPELAISLLACAKIGAIHSVVFAGFSAQSIKDRIMDCGATFVITADHGWRRGKLLNLKDIVDEAVTDCVNIKNMLVIKRSEHEKTSCHMQKGRDYWYADLMNDAAVTAETEEMDSEDMLFLLYTSGTTGKPKGIVHTTGGYMVYAYLTAKYIFDLKETDVYWCTADIGWITGHSYVVYGPLLNGATCLMYEGAPDYPDKARMWEIIEKYGVSIFYTAPTAIRAFMKWGDDWVKKHDISSLRLLGTVGESINPEAWMWYHRVIGNEKCPIVDTWWQTETGGIMITSLPGAVETKPGCATLPFLGIEAGILDANGQEADTGFLAVKSPWPGMLRGIYGDDERFRATYWSKWENTYFPGDGAHKDKDGYFWLLGRVDDVINVSGHRLGTSELESIFVADSVVAEAAVIGIKHEIKGQAVVAFISLKEGINGDKTLEGNLKKLISEKVGKFAMPERIIFSGELPKTRSGKIMRRLLRDIAEGRSMGNITTLADSQVVESLKEKYEED